MTFSKLMGQFHKWLALILGVQLLLWFVSGIVLAEFPKRWVGDTYQRNKARTQIDLRDVVLSPQEIFDRLGDKRVRQINLLPFLDGAAYHVQLAGGDDVLFDAHSGHQLSPLSEALARDVARRDFVGAYEIISAELIQDEHQFYGGELPVWRITLDNPQNSWIYVSPSHGRIDARVHNSNRVRRFFAQLHLMNYSSWGKVNHMILVAAGFAGIVLSLSGLYLIFTRFRRRDFKWLLRK